MPTYRLSPFDSMGHWRTLTLSNSLNNNNNIHSQRPQWVKPPSVWHRLSWVRE